MEKETHRDMDKQSREGHTGDRIDLGVWDRVDVEGQWC